MAKKEKKINLRESSKKELLEILKEKRKILFNLKTDFNLGKLKDTSLLKKTRKEIARIKTLIKEKEWENEKI